MPWIFLITAGLFEVVWAIAIKYTVGFTKLTPSLITVTAMAISMFFLSRAIKTLPMGTAYAIWTGIGVLGTAILGIFLFGEPAGLFRITCIFLLILAILGLKLSS